MQADLLLENAVTRIEGPLLFARREARVGLNSAVEVLAGTGPPPLGRVAALDEPSNGIEVLEPTSGLKDVADLARSAGLGFDAVRSIQSGTLLPAVELHQQLGLGGPIRTEQAIPMGDDGLLIGAMFHLEGPDLPQPIYPYRNFLDMQGVRSIHDI